MYGASPLDTATFVQQLYVNVLVSVARTEYVEPLLYDG